jgi:hypothetical protein
MTDEGGGRVFDGSQRPTIDYIDRSRAYYLAAGYDNPYRWAQHHDAPFARLAQPMSETRVGLITTAARNEPGQVARRPHDPRERTPKFPDVYSQAVDRPPDLRISHVSYDRDHTIPDDVEAFFPLAGLTWLAEEGRIGSVAPRFHGLPTTYSQRSTTEEHAPEILRRCREDGVGAALLVPI